VRLSLVLPELGFVGCMNNGFKDLDEWIDKRLAIELAGLVVKWERQRQNEMKVVTAPNQISDFFNPSSADGKLFRSRVFKAQDTENLSRVLHINFFKE